MTVPRNVVVDFDLYFENENGVLMCFCVFVFVVLCDGPKEVGGGGRGTGRGIVTHVVARLRPPTFNDCRRAYHETICKLCIVDETAAES